MTWPLADGTTGEPARESAGLLPRRFFLSLYSADGDTIQEFDLPPQGQPEEVRAQAQAQLDGALEELFCVEVIYFYRATRHLLRAGLRISPPDHPHQILGLEKE